MYARMYTGLENILETLNALTLYKKFEFIHSFLTKFNLFQLKSCSILYWPEFKISIQFQTVRGQ